MISEHDVYWVVVTCQKRKEQGFDARNVFEAVPGLNEFYDPYMKGTVWSHVKALRQGFESGARWIVMFQDDIILCNDFYSKALKRIEEAELLGFKLFQYFRPMDFPEDDRRWQIEKGATYLWDQAAAFRYDFARKWLSWASDYEDTYYDEKEGHDSLLGKYLKEVKQDYAICVPNLVDHNIDMDSTLGTAKNCFGRPRNSRTFSMGAD